MAIGIAGTMALSVMAIGDTEGAGGARRAERGTRNSGAGISGGGTDGPTFVADAAGHHGRAFGSRRVALESAG